MPYRCYITVGYCLFLHLLVSFWCRQFVHMMTQVYMIDLKVQTILIVLLAKKERFTILNYVCSK